MIKKKTHFFRSWSKKNLPISWKVTNLYTPYASFIPKMNIMSEKASSVFVTNIPKNELKKSYALAGFEEIVCFMLNSIETSMLRAAKNKKEPIMDLLFGFLKILQ